MQVAEPGHEASMQIIIVPSIATAGKCATYSTLSLPLNLDVHDYHAGVLLQSGNLVI